jgi:DnaK suppressor protein
MALSQEDLKRMADSLTSQKATLSKRISLIHDHARNPLNADSSEQAAELGNVDVVEALENDAVIEIAEIEAALQRIGNGVYGTCITCGEDIATARLEARPESTDCVECAEDTQRLHSLKQ